LLNRRFKKGAGEEKTSSKASPICTFKGEKMVRTLLIIGLILLVLWLLGFITSYTLGGGIHILLAIAIIMIIISLVSGRRIKN